MMGGKSSSFPLCSQAWPIASVEAGCRKSTKGGSGAHQIQFVAVLVCQSWPVLHVLVRCCCNQAEACLLLSQKDYVAHPSWGIVVVFQSVPLREAPQGYQVSNECSFCICEWRACCFVKRFVGMQ